MRVCKYCGQTYICRLDLSALANLSSSRLAPLDPLCTTEDDDGNISETDGRLGTHDGRVSCLVIIDSKVKYFVVGILRYIFVSFSDSFKYKKINAPTCNFKNNYN